MMDFIEHNLWVKRVKELIGASEPIFLEKWAEENDRGCGFEGFITLETVGGVNYGEIEISAVGGARFAGSGLPSEIICFVFKPDRDGWRDIWGYIRAYLGERGGIRLTDIDNFSEWAQVIESPEFAQTHSFKGAVALQIQKEEEKTS